MSEVFKFLRWKLAHYVDHFSELDKYIVNTNALDKFTKLSCKSCSYSKLCIKLYTENLWQGSVVNQWLCEGRNTIPQVSCDLVALNRFIPRNIETLTLSMLYPNNLLNQFLFEHFPAICNSPVCDCNESVQSLFHVAFECNVNSSNNKQTIHQLKSICNFQDSFNNLSPEDLSTLFLNYSRDKNFMSLLVKRIFECLPFLKCNISLS